MTDSDNLRDIIKRQKELFSQLEDEANGILESDLVRDNESLKKEVDQNREELIKQREKLKQLSSENSKLKNALYDQIYSEKIRLVASSCKRSDIFFKNTVDGELNRLTQLEKDLQDRTARISAELKKSSVDASSELLGQLDALSAKANELITDIRVKAAKETDVFSKHSSEQFKRLKEEQITDESIAAIGKKNNLEAFVGGNLINKLGILFVILGIIAVSRFTFFQLPDTFKGILMFVISGLFLLAGEILNKKKANIFSLGITSCGVAGLYVSLSISYFALNILSMYPALLLCVLITTGAFVLSQRYNSETIASFALIGGYIPVVSISESLVLTYSAMVYFVALNLFALLISFNKRWKISMFIGFFLNLAGTIYISANMVMKLRYITNDFTIQHAYTIVYVLFAFAVYTIIPIMSNYRKKQSFTKADVVILGLNTFFSALIMYALFIAFDMSRFNGLIAMIFAVIYLGLGRFVESGFKSEKSIIALFYLMGLVFVILVIPFQFGKEWLSLGWLVQGVSLAVYGILAEQKSFKKAGFVIGALCLGAFLFFDVVLDIGYLFSYKYMAVTAGSLAILAALAYKKSLVQPYEKVFKYVVLVNLWVYCLYAASLLDTLLITHNAWFLTDLSLVTVTFLYAILLPRVSVLSDKGAKIISIVISLFGTVWLMALTGSNSYVVGESLQVTVVATIVLITLCALALIAMYSVLMFFVLEARLPVEWLPFVLSVYLLIMVTQNLICQYNLALTSIVISLLFVVAALAWIVFGFTKRFSFVRRFGLALSVLAVAKLFLIDLPGLTEGYKIVSYFAFGVTLLGISFIYQYFGKRLLPEYTAIGREVAGNEDKEDVDDF